MKKTFLLFFSVWLSVKMVGQAPGQMNYQGVARSALGLAMPNQNIKLRITVRDGSANGSVLYKETRLVKTNHLGLFSVAIGGPGKTDVTGDLLSINWTIGGAKFLQVEMDPNGGNDLKDMGATQLLSVPYALSAGAAVPAGVAGGMLTGLYPNPSIANGVISTIHLADNSVTGVKIADGVITTNKIADGSVTLAKLAVGSGLPPVGNAGGDLGGTYPNPIVAVNAITAAKIADGAVGSTKLGNNAVTSAKLADNAVTSSKLVDGSVGNAKIANNAVNTSKIADGSITTIKIDDIAVTTGKLANSAVTTPKIADGSITSAKLAAGISLPPGGAASGDLTGSYPNPFVAANAINTSKLADGSVTNAKLVNSAVNTMKIADEAVTTGKLADAAVDAVKLKDGAVTNTKLANTSVGTTKIMDEAVTTAKIADGAITSDKLAVGLTTPPGGAASGDLTGTFPSPAVAAGAITSAKLANDAVTTGKVVDGAVTTAKLDANAVTTAKIADASVTDVKLANNAVVTNKIADIAVTTAKLADASVTNAKLANTSVGTTKLQDEAITTAKIADGAITSNKLAAGLTIPPGGAASGDLTGTFPSPAIAANAITSAKLANDAVTTVKVVDGAITTAKLDANAVTTAKIADASVTDVKLANNAVVTNKIADVAVTTAKLADASVTNAKLANTSVGTTKLQDEAVTSAKIADGAITSNKLAVGLSIPPGGAASGDLTGTFPGPTVAANAINATKLADDAVTSAKVLNGAITTVKLDDAAVTALKLAANAVTTAKILDANVTTVKIADGAITADKLASGLSLPPGGTATGDLDGNYPAPTVAKLKGVDLSATAPATGEVLTFDGTAWAPAAVPGLVLPYIKTVNEATKALSITNDGDAPAIEGVNNSTTDNVAGVTGIILNDNAGLDVAGVKGINNATYTNNGTGVLGIHNGLGSGVRGYSVNGTGVEAFSEESIGIYARSARSTAAYIEVSDASAGSDALTIVHQGYGIGITSISSGSHGIFGGTLEPSRAAVIGQHYNGGEGVQGVTFSDVSSGVSGVNTGLAAAVKGYNDFAGGMGIMAQATSATGAGGTALVAELLGDPEGDVAVFKVNNTNVARIDANGTGYFANGAQTGGADVAEMFDVEGIRSAYEAGDVLVISETSDRMVTKSSGAYSTLVAGVYATKPGLMLTEKDALKSHLDKMVPMGVIGVIPTKVCLEGGAIKRGDLLVTSSIPGVAMKADPDKVRVGQVLGKALQDYNTNTVGKINVLVSVK